MLQFERIGVNSQISGCWPWPQDAPRSVYCVYVNVVIVSSSSQPGLGPGFLGTAPSLRAVSALCVHKPPHRPRCHFIDSSGSQQQRSPPPLLLLLLIRPQQIRLRSQDLGRTVLLESDGSVILSRFEALELNSSGVRCFHRLLTCFCFLLFPFRVICAASFSLSLSGFHPFWFLPPPWWLSPMFNYPHLPVVYLDSVLFTLFVTSSVHFVSVHDPDAAPVPWGRLIFVSVIAFTVNRPVGTDENWG